MTLIEIMVVITILGLIATLVAVAANERMMEARRHKALLDLRALASALELYRVHRGSFPTPENGLEILVRERFIRELPADPWGSPYVYVLQNGEPVLSSLGADREPGGHGAGEDIRLGPPAP
jgi:general secretion pathway protein G